MQMAAVDEADELRSVRSIGHLRSHSSEEDFNENMNGLEIAEKADLVEIKTETESALVAPSTRQSKIFGRELTNLQIPKRGQVFEVLENEKEVAEHSSMSLQIESHTSDQETSQALVSELDHTNFNEEKGNESDIEIIPEESILKRINSHKGMKSYQLGKQLSCKWTTGAGPRIGCVRDYPCELQLRALEQVNLSPRSGSRTRSSFAVRNTSLNSTVSCVSSLIGEIGETTTELVVENQNSRSELFSPLIRGTSVIPLIHMTHE